jgi:two-component system chemotaxis response regulator CheB
LKKKIRVLIVDDSAMVRQTLREILSSDPRIEVMAAVADPLLAADKIRDEVPDVITLDVEMPRMDGITFLQKIMSQHPIPVIICSSHSGEGSDNALRALEYGAIEIIQKPDLCTKQNLEESRIRLCDAVKAASVARLKCIPSRMQQVPPKLSADVILRNPARKKKLETTEKVVVVGASTGGTEALVVLLGALPYDAPGMVVVQHMPENFTAAYAKRLNTLCRVTVKEAADNDRVLPGHVLISPGNRHILLKESGARYYVALKEGPLVNRHRPSVNVLFRSAARYAGKNAIGVILTGMGDDGAKGLLEMKEAGAYTIAQDKDSCVIYGMPKEAVKLGAVDVELPLEKIMDKIMENIWTLSGVR